ncbi:hypothetical protein C7974DRAFT_411969 [Boeremia exigua]|uniref:uncharacterized protein n=1 Tax=Boeremia exigua TaxID=749465 RepID=UPI001E8E4A9F|nr:uncharacterized protein C7974DRAFT_411969 [Boeremia exigua]KAH6632937.1 hypothetical protein C7974DRAFT_411969 [Boeremia exigua]
MSAGLTFDERVWMHLYHHLVLAVIDYNGSVIERLDDATLHRAFYDFFPYSLERSIFELDSLRNVLLPELMGQFHRWPIEASRGLEVDIPDITAEMVEEYACIACVDGLTLPDLPGVDFGELWAFLNDKVQNQYFVQPHDLLASNLLNSVSENEASSVLTHTPHDDSFDHGNVDSDAGVAPSSKHAKETFEILPSGGVRARFSLVNEGKEYVQIDHLPKKKPGLTSGSSDTYIMPNPSKHTVPILRSGQQWTRKSSKEFVWVSGDEEWAMKAIFRVFRKDNHEYVKYRHPEACFQSAVDPNDKDWRTYYNKTLRKIVDDCQSDYVSDVKRARWTEDEQRAIYRSINKWCKEHGVHNFPPRDLQSLYRQVTKDVNKECHEGDKDACRSEDAVRSQVQRGLKGEGNKTSPITDLVHRATRIKGEMENGVKFSKAKLYPDNAITIPGKK